MKVVLTRKRDRIGTEQVQSKGQGKPKAECKTNARADSTESTQTSMMIGTCRVADCDSDLASFVGALDPSKLAMRS